MGVPIKGTPYGNLHLGNEDKLMITYKRDTLHYYTMDGACSVIYEGEMHFFGAEPYRKTYSDDYAFLKQHFTIDTKRRGKMIRMTRQHDLEIKFYYPSCSTFETTSQYFPWLRENIVVLCFGGPVPSQIENSESKCYSFDGNSIGKISNKTIGNSNFGHFDGGLVKYKQNLVTVGGNENQKTEILERNSNGKYIWTTLQPDFEFTERSYIQSHSLVNIKSSDMNDEYILLSGGTNNDREVMKHVYKFNGTWQLFGQLRRPRASHSSIYWNGAVYFIGGRYRFNGYFSQMFGDLIHIFNITLNNWNKQFNDTQTLSDWLPYLLFELDLTMNYLNYSVVDEIDKDLRVRMEIWKIQDLPDRFETTENWPELFNWGKPHLFIVQDSFFPDY